MQPAIALRIEPSSVVAASITGAASIVTAPSAPISTPSVVSLPAATISAALPVERVASFISNASVNGSQVIDRLQSSLAEDAARERAAILKLHSFEHAIVSLEHGQAGSLDVTSLTDVHTWSLDDDVLDALVTAPPQRALTAFVRCANGALKVYRSRRYTHQSAAFG